MKAPSILPPGEHLPEIKIPNCNNMKIMVAFWNEKKGCASQMIDRQTAMEGTTVIYNYFHEMIGKPINNSRVQIELKELVGPPSTYSTFEILKMTLIGVGPID